MIDLITAAFSNSTDDGSGPDLSPTPPQLDNDVDELLLIQVTTSRNSGNGSAPTVNTPAGWTLQLDQVDNELRMYVFSKQSTGSETFPVLTSVGVASEWSCSSTVIRDVDYVNGPFGNSAVSTAGGDHDSPNITYTTSGTANTVLCFFGLERRSIQGFRTNNTEDGTVLLGTTTTGTQEGVDNSVGIAYDFKQNASGTFNGPFWETSGGGDSIAFNLEILTLNNIRPLFLSLPPTSDLPANTNQLNQDWCDFIIDSGFEPDGTPLPTALNFDASLANTVTNEITIVGHNLVETQVCRVESNGNTLPTGLTDGGLYWVRPTSNDDLQLVEIIDDPDASSDMYTNNANLKSEQNISAVGSGTCILRPALINSQSSGGVASIYRPPNGSTSLPTAFSNGWIGDSAYNENWFGAVTRFNSVFDATDETLGFTWFSNNSNGRIRRVLALFIDEDGDWITFNLYDKATQGSTNFTKFVQIQPESTIVQNISEYESGTFDGTRIRYFGLVIRGAKITVSRPSNTQISTIGLANPLIVSGGSPTQFADFTSIVEFLITRTDAVSQPSDIQFVSLSSIQLGTTSSEIFFRDGEKSIAFPPLADGINSLGNYVESLGLSLVAFNETDITLNNSQIGASVPFDFVVDKGGTASKLEINGNTYVFGNVELDSDMGTVSRQLFVGGNGIIDNTVPIINSTFFVNNQVGSNNGMVNWNQNINISDSTFEASSELTDGHGILISSTGSYDFNSIFFTDFGSSGSNTAAVYNDSGGEVTLNILSGDVPTVRNGTSSSTIIQSSFQITYTGIPSNTQVIILIANTTTELALGIVTQSNQFSWSGNAGVNFDARFVNNEFEIVELYNEVVPSTNVVQSLQFRFDRNYQNL